MNLTDVFGAVKANAPIIKEETEKNSISKNQEELKNETITKLKEFAADLIRKLVDFKNDTLENMVETVAIFAINWLIDSFVVDWLYPEA